MDWNRGERQSQPVGQAVNPTAAPTTVKRQRGGLAFPKSIRIAQVGLLFSATVLIVAVVWYLAIGGGKAEGSYVDDKKLQAVFLNGGQVYFGNIDDLNGKFLSMSDIYYLRVNQQVQPNQSNSNSSNDISLVKLGCELHGPEDSMVINREQVIFWENLKDDGQVAKAVAEYQKQNPNGQKCETTTNSSSNTNTTTDDTSNTSTNNSTTNNTTTNTGTNKPTTTR